MAAPLETNRLKLRKMTIDDTDESLRIGQVLKM